VFEETRESTGISDWEKLLADGEGEEGMTDPYSVYNALIDHMCSHCNQTIRRRCNLLPEETRCKNKIWCMKHILEPNHENYPIRLPYGGKIK